MSIACTDGIRGGMGYTPLAQKSATDNKMQDNSATTHAVTRVVDPEKQSAITNFFVRQGCINFQIINIEIHGKDQNREISTNTPDSPNSFVGKHVKIKYELPDRSRFEGERVPNFRGKEEFDWALKKRGYSSAENFIRNVKEDAEKAQQAKMDGFLTPAEQAEKWLKNGVCEEYKIAIETDYNQCLEDMKGKSRSEKREIIRDFYNRWNEILSHKIPAAFDREMEKISHVLHHIIKNIRYNEPNPYFPKGNWAWTADRKKWEKDNENRLPEALNSVNNALTNGKKTLSDLLKDLFLQCVSQLRKERNKNN